MDLKDLASITSMLFGLAGFVISCITLTRSRSAAAEARALSQRQERQAVLALAIEAKLSTTADLRRWERTQRTLRARRPIAVEWGDRINPQATAMIKSTNNAMQIARDSAQESIDLLIEAVDMTDAFRLDLLKEIPDEYSEVLTKNLSAVRLQLLEMANSKLTEEKSGRIFDEVAVTLDRDDEIRAHLSQALSLPVAVLSSKPPDPS
jgi:hypothetical protein